MTVQQDISKIYIGYFGRSPEPEGFNYWIGEATDGGDGPGGRPPLSLTQIAASFSVQPESRDLYPYLANPNVADPAVFVTSVYQNLFNRDPDDEGLNFWVGELNDAQGDPQAVGAMIINIISGARNTEAGQDRTIIENKTEVALDWAQSTAEVAGFEYTDAAASEAKAVLDDVDDTQGSIDAGKAQTDAFIASGAGQTVNTIPLTDEVDNLTGSNAPDLFTGTDETLNNGDDLNGSGGDDTLRIIAADDVDVTPTLTSIENLIAQAVGGYVELSFGASSGVQRATLQDSNEYLEINDIDEIIGLAAVRTNDDDAYFDINYTDAATGGDDDVQMVTLEDAILSDIEATGIEIVNITATGTNDAGDVDGRDYSIQGDGDVKLSLNVGSSFDKGTLAAGSATGDIDVDVRSNKDYDIETGTGNDLLRMEDANDVNASSGDGDDTIRMGDDLDSDDTLDGGEGKDTLSISRFEDAEEDDVNAASGFEVLRAEDESRDVNLAEYDDIDEFVFAGENDSNDNRISVDGVESDDLVIFAINQNSNQDEAVQFDAERAGEDLTFELLATEDDGAVEITNNNGNSGSATIGFDGGFGSVTIRSAREADEDDEDPNAIISNDDGSGNRFAFDNDDGLVSFTIVGDKDLAIEAIVGNELTTGSGPRGFTNEVNVNAEDFTGDLRIAGSQSDDVIRGGSGDDIIYGLAGADQLTGNGGADQFRLIGNDDAKEIVDFTIGTDKIGVNEFEFDNTDASQAGTELSSEDYIENLSSIASISSAEEFTVIELQTALSENQIETGTGADVEAFLLVFNSSDNRAELWYDDNWADTDGRDKVMEFDNIDSLSEMQTFANSDFVYYDF